MVVSACSWTHVCPPKLDGKPHLRFTCFSPVHVENAATSFSFPTWDVVDHIHKDTAAYIDEHSRLWTRPYHDVDQMKKKRWQPLRKSHNGFPCFGLQQLSILNCVLTNTFAEQAHFPTISSGIRTPDTCKNILGNVQFSEGIWKIRVRSRSHGLRPL